MIRAALSCRSRYLLAGPRSEVIRAALSYRSLYLLHGLLTVVHARGEPEEVPDLKGTQSEVISAI